MEKHQLAQELRQRQYDKGLIARWMIDAVSDDDMIDSYITCPGCHEKQVDSQHLAAAIDLAQDANQFFDFCDEFASTHAKKTHAEPQKKRPPHGRSFQRTKNVPFKKRDW
ncbi:MAG: hypothetical protein ACRDHZ_24090 [Ktedonobacteraceae bacterium]